MNDIRVELVTIYTVPRLSGRQQNYNSLSAGSILSVYCDELVLWQPGPFCKLSDVKSPIRIVCHTLAAVGGRMPRPTLVEPKAPASEPRSRSHLILILGLSGHESGKKVLTPAVWSPQNMGKSLVGSPMHPGPDKNLARTWALRRGPCFESATLKSEGTRGGVGCVQGKPSLWKDSFCSN